MEQEKKRFGFPPAKLAKVGLVLIPILLVSGFALWPKSKPNIVLVCIDTLRADYFTPEYMPKSYAWAEKHAKIYTNAHAPSTWTLPSHLSMFTGLMPFEHRVNLETTAIPPDMPLLAEQMKKKGYHTAAFTGGGFLFPGYGFDRGFDVFRGYLPNPGSDDSQEHGEAFTYALDYLAQAASPYFVFVHTYAVHQYLAGHDSAEECNSQECCTSAYAARVKECDELIGRFLKQTPKDAIVIFTSDHGERLFEPCMHALPPYPDQTHIPLAISGHGVETGIVSTLFLYDFILHGKPIEPQAIVIAEATEVTNGDYAHRATITESGSLIQEVPPPPRRESNRGISEIEAQHLKSLGYLK